MRLVLEFGIRSDFSYLRYFIDDVLGILLLLASYRSSRSSSCTKRVCFLLDSSLFCCLLSLDFVLQVELLSRWCVI